MSIGELDCVGPRDQERRPSDIWIGRDEVVWESRVEILDALEVSDSLLGELETQRRDIVLQVLDLPAAHDGKDVGRFGHHVRQGRRPSPTRCRAPPPPWPAPRSS